MQKNKILIAVATAMGVALPTFTILAQQDDEEPPEMGVFLTSVGQGNGGDLGGLTGADAHCQQLASNAGVGHRTWHAYLSTQGPRAMNAHDRIGEGPWANANGLVMATGVENLHYDNPKSNLVQSK